MSPDENTPWQYAPDSTTQPNTAAGVHSASAAVQPAPAQPGLSWTAAEYVNHPHGFGWYLMLVVFSVGLATAIYLLTKDYFATGTVIVLGLIVGGFAVRQPREITYEITASGLRIGAKKYPYNLFKSFSVLREGPLTSVNLLPGKRFMPPVSAYFDPKAEQQITNTLGQYLPYEDHKLELVERLSRRLRF